jgi:quinol monooxygenase YgiN
MVFVAIHTSCMYCVSVSSTGARLDAFRSLCGRLVEKTRDEPKCLYYGFGFDGEEVHCREAYRDADGLLAHLENVGP